MALQGVASTLEEIEGVAGVSRAVPNRSQHPTAVLWKVTPETSPQDNATADLVRDLRGDIITGLNAAMGTDIKVTGPVAANVDFSDYLAERIFYFFGAVLLISFLFVIVVFRSVLAPIKAVVVDLLAIGASYGVVVAVFQWG